MKIRQSKGIPEIPSLKTSSSHLKIDSWKTILWGGGAWLPFSCELFLSGCVSISISSPIVSLNSEPWHCEMKDYPFKIPGSPKSESFPADTSCALAFDIIITLWVYGKFSCDLCSFWFVSIEILSLAWSSKTSRGSPSPKLTCPLHSVLILFHNLSAWFQKKKCVVSTRWDKWWRKKSLNTFGIDWVRRVAARPGFLSPRGRPDDWLEKNWVSGVRGGSTFEWTTF